MAQRSPRGQFSGHLPLTHHSCGNQPGRGGREGGGGGGDGAAKRGLEACTYRGSRVGGGGRGWGGREREGGWGGRKRGVEGI